MIEVDVDMSGMGDAIGRSLDREAAARRLAGVREIMASSDYWQNPEKQRRVAAELAGAYPGVQTPNLGPLDR